MDGTGESDFGNPTWSRDSEYIYFDTFGHDAAFFRVRIRDRKVERIVGLKNVPRAVGTFGPWTGLAPDGSPLFQRDASFDEIYALDWDARKLFKSARPVAPHLRNIAPTYLHDRSESKRGG